MLPFPISLVFSKWTYIVIAVVLAIVCGVLIWLGGYETPALIFAGGAATQSWSWRYENLQKAAVICGAISAILAILISIGTAIFGGGNQEYDPYEDYYEY